MHDYRLPMIWSIFSFEFLVAWQILLAAMQNLTTLCYSEYKSMQKESDVVFSDPLREQMTKPIQWDKREKLKEPDMSFNGREKVKCRRDLKQPVMHGGAETKNI